MQLVADTTSVEQRRPGRREGARDAEPLRRHHHRRGPHRPRALEDPELHVLQDDLREADRASRSRSPNVVVKLPNGQQNNIYGNAEDACSFVTMFQDIADTGRQEPQQHELDQHGEQLRPGPGDEHRLRVAARGQVRRRRHLRPRRVRPDHPPNGDWTHVTPRSSQRRSSRASEARRRSSRRSGVAALDGAVVGAEVGRDDERVVAHVVRACPRRSPRRLPCSRSRSLSERIIGRSCSTTTSVASSSCCTRLISGPNASASRWATPAVGSSRQMTRGATASTDASSTMRRVPVESSAMKRSA